MNIKKEEYNGAMYQGAIYPAGFLPQSSPRERAGRKKLTTAAKKVLNAKKRVYRLMQTICANFTGGRDLFVCLTYKAAPEGGRCLEYFHRAMRRAYKKHGLAYKYVARTEAHDMEGTPVREHHHLILSGTWGGLRQLAALIQEAWPYGTVDVRTLREGSDFFEDTARYFIKDSNPRFAHTYSCSRNLDKPREPLRRRVPEREGLETPPGVKLIQCERSDNEFGRFGWMVGKIVDKAAFEDYWRRAERKALGDPWERLRRRRRRLGIN